MQAPGGGTSARRRGYLGPWLRISSACWNVGRLIHSIRGWETAPIGLNSISCPSTSLCVAVDGTGHVITSTNPTGGPSAWKPALVDGDPCNDTTSCSMEQILASAGRGVETVDSSKLPGDGPFLTGLTLNGDVLSWSHDGTPKNVMLH